MNIGHWILLLAGVLCVPPALAAEEPQSAPWGSAQELAIEYKPQKVLYDLFSGNIATVRSVIDRVSFLNNIYHSDPFASSIVIVIHGSAVPFFATGNYPRFNELMQRAQSLTVGTNVEFRMCRQAARLLNYSAKDIHGFVKMVPMADAEIVRLQNEEGYAYMVE